MNLNRGRKISLAFRFRVWYRSGMTLKEYLVAKSMTLAEFGALSGNSHASVSRWANGVMLPSFKAALKIEEITGGKVSRHDLRPDVYGPKRKK